jgi:DNA-binding transcriptional LysR family regulator
MAEELNTYKAAERLKVDQSTVSKGIKRFEKKQELTMFVRESKRRIADLTPRRCTVPAHLPQLARCGGDSSRCTAEDDAAR